MAPALRMTRIIGEKLSFFSLASPYTLKSPHLPSVLQIAKEKFLGFWKKNELLCSWNSLGNFCNLEGAGG
jgi:hypothetical protein